MQVGKAWLYLSKAYQNYASRSNDAEYKEKGEAALFRQAPSLMFRNPALILET